MTTGEVACCLRDAGLATLLLDLLSPEEELDRRNVFDIGLLASRLRRSADWAAEHAETAALRPCYFGASTGGGAALRASAEDARIAARVGAGPTLPVQRLCHGLPHRRWFLQQLGERI